MEDFDAAAADYDSIFTNSCVGKAQRDQVWKYIDATLLPHSQKVLEVNCGTGEDAKRWRQRKKDIVATDISPEMIALARKKFPDIPFNTLDVNKIQDVDETFDTLFSNFGGLNCLSPQQLEDFIQNAHRKIAKNGHLALVIMGKKCLWERLYFAAKGNRKQRIRRNTNQAVPVTLEGKAVKTWYYSPQDVLKRSAPFYSMVTVRPIGLFVPPSYLAPAFEKRKRMFGFLRWLDKIFTHPSFGNNADHYLLVLKKREHH